MKTTKFITAVLAIFAIAFLSTLESCKKETTGTNEPTATKSGLLTQSSWVMTSNLVTFPDPVGERDVFALQDACAKDDLILFKSDKTVQSDEGALKWDPNAPQTSMSGTWELTSNDTKVVMTDGGDVVEFKINTLTSSELILETTTYDSTLQADLTIKAIFKH
tara:strand:- start:21113 stop:21601 length:489 start_codon:yes stop_codon:yes gene_type:complete